MTRSDRHPMDPASIFAECLASLPDGAAPDADALAAAHPEHAETLRSLCTEWRRVESALADDRTVHVTGDGADDSAWSRFLDQLRTRGPAHSRYVFKGELARGGMGVIHHVFDQDARRNLAMKVILGQAEPDPTGDTPTVDERVLGRFLEEAQVTSQLDHPGVVPVHEIGLDGVSRVYFTMKLVKGVDLRAVFDKVHDPTDDSWSVTRALHVLLRVCEAMAYAHDKGVIHRDLKPGNVMVGRFGEVYVMDWGLARVLTRADGKDLRIRPADLSRTELRTERRDAASDTPDDPLMTMDGDVLGTPAYMPPEQAEGRIEDMGPPADVYAMGAMVYHLLAGHMPYVQVGARLSNRTILGMVLHGPPPPIGGEAKDASAELVAICERAMARSIADRYPDMTALARDLRAYLEQRVVAAYETGAIAELKKWVHRNKALAATAAAALVAVLGLSGWAVIERGKAETNEALATQRADDAEREKRTAHARKAEFDQLAGVVRLREAEESEKDLYPAWPEKVAAMENWLDDWGQIEALQPQLSRTLADLEARAMPPTDDQRRADREGHPKYQAYLATVRKVESLRRAQSVRDGAEPTNAALRVDLTLVNPRELERYAWRRVTPDPAERLFGQEAEALAAARAAVAAVREKGGSPTPSLLDTLAWALFWCGQDDAAREASLEAETAATEERAKYAGYRARLESAIASADDSVAAAEEELAALDAELSVSRTRTFANDAEGFLHGALSDLDRRIDAFAAGPAADVRRRLNWARQIEEITQRHPGSRVTWQQARAALATADGEHASTLYREHPIDLKPQMGLVPIGMNPVTKLWEFYHLRSACELAAGEDPAAVEIPSHQEDGTIPVSESTGIVFVLLPGGTFLMGAQAQDESKPNYDPGAESDEWPVHEVTLSPFFLARHELTQGQWRRLTGETPSYYGPHNYLTEWNESGLPADWTHPVERVSHDDCTLWLGRVGLLLPTESQWEYGARAGTDTPWWTGWELSKLYKAGNLADPYTLKFEVTWANESDLLDDGNLVHGRVGSYKANRFGLHDTIGNVWEWCRDELLYYYVAEPRPGDGLREGGFPVRMDRGGAFDSSAARARSGSRDKSTPSSRDNSLGARAARALVR